MDKIFITGDIHGNFSDLKKRIIDSNAKELILLGDTGINWYSGKKDNKFKKDICDLDCNIYAIRGNHDMPPFEVNNIQKIYHKELQNYVYSEEAYPKIFYLIDGEVYNFDGYKCLVLGGAYSVDKYYRISQGWIWFEHEQIPEEERIRILEAVRGKKFDFILSHTCPITWQPTDLFLSVINQDTVDHSMENWLEEVKNNCDYEVWLFGHYHRDRIERPCAEMYYKKLDTLDNIYQRWEVYNNTKQLDWWLEKSPNFYME